MDQLVASAARAGAHIALDRYATDLTATTDRVASHAGHQARLAGAELGLDRQQQADAARQAQAIVRDA